MELLESKSVGLTEASLFFEKLLAQPSAEKEGKILRQLGFMYLKRRSKTLF